MYYISRNDYEKLTYEEVVELAEKHLDDGNLKFKADGFYFRNMFMTGVNKDNYLKPEQSIRKLLMSYSEDDFEKLMSDDKLFNLAKFDIKCPEPTRAFLV